MRRRVARVVLDPEPPPPSLVCPKCDLALHFKQAIFGGVNPEERWDYFECRTCGEFVYRERTRKLRSA
jgi:hypothetical protein